VINFFMFPKSDIKISLNLTWIWGRFLFP
jgi:hypothetical protein